MAKQKRENIYENTEPLWKYVKGTGNFNALRDVDQFEKWSTNLSGEEVEDLEVEMKAMLDEAVKLAEEKGKVVKNVADLYKTYEGKKFIVFKKKQYDEETKGPKLYNVHGDELVDLKGFQEPGGGSTLRVRAIIKPYYMATTKTVGLSYGMLACQIIDNKQYVGASGFGDESGGAKEEAPFETESEDY